MLRAIRSRSAVTRTIALRGMAQAIKAATRIRLSSSICNHFKRDAPTVDRRRTAQFPIGRLEVAARVSA
jgi:head-tail adaptor